MVAGITVIDAVNVDGGATGLGEGYARPTVVDAFCPALGSSADIHSAEDAVFRIHTRSISLWRYEVAMGHIARSQQR